MDLARNLIDEGFKVKLTKPREGEEEGFVLTYFIPIKVNYQVKYPPKIYLVAGDAEPRLLNEDTIDVLDKIRVKNVDVTLAQQAVYGYGEHLSTRKRASAASALRRAAAPSNESPTQWVSFESLSKILF